MIAGAVVMTFGIYLLTTLDVDSTQRTVALYLMVTGLGLGPLMPSATLAVQSTVEKWLPGGATYATPFPRSPGSARRAGRPDRAGARYRRDPSGRHPHP